MSNQHQQPGFLDRETFLLQLRRILEEPRSLSQLRRAINLIFVAFAERDRQAAQLLESERVRKRAARWDDPKEAALRLLGHGGPDLGDLGEADGDATSALERVFDPSRHPRGGFVQNRGWFSRAWGSGANSKNVRQAKTQAPPQRDNQTKPNFRLVSDKKTDDASTAKIPPPSISKPAPAGPTTKTPISTNAPSSSKPQQPSAGNVAARGAITYMQIMAAAGYAQQAHAWLQQEAAKRLADAVNGGLITQRQAAEILKGVTWMTGGHMANPRDRLVTMQRQVNKEIRKLVVANAVVEGLSTTEIAKYLETDDLQGLTNATKAHAAAQAQTPKAPPGQQSVQQPNPAAGDSGKKNGGGKPPATGEEDDGRPKKRYRGGRHRDTSQPPGDGLQSHHIPPDSVNGLKLGEGPAIQMDPADHASTSSHSWQGEEGAAWRATQRELIEKGRFGEAIQKDIDDIRDQFGHKYDEAIREMIRSLDPWMRVGLKG